MADGTNASDPFAYEDASGKSIDTSTESGLRAALADAHARLLALETAPKPTGGTGADSERLARLEAAVGPFFRDQLATYDAEAASAAPAGISANAASGPAA